MSVVGPPDAVFESNRKLFARYMSIFRNRNPQDFVQYATRFAKWLGDSKAYYPEARQEIISLLLIAQANLRRTLGLHDEFSKAFHVDHFPNNEMVAAYAAMVRAVEPFSGYFVEPSLSAHLFKLRETVAASSSSATSMSSNYAVPANPLPLPPQPNHQHNAPHGSGSSLPKRTTTPVVSNPQAPMASSSSTLPSNGAPLPLAAQMKHHPPPHPRGASPPQSSHSRPPNPTIPPKPQHVIKPPPQKKIVKKRKTLDYQELYSQDIQSFLQKKKANQPTTPLFLPSDTSSVTPEPAQRASPLGRIPITGTSVPTSVAADAHQTAISSPGSITVVNHTSPGHAETSSGDMVVTSEQQMQGNDERTNPDPVVTPAPISEPTNPQNQRPTDDGNSKTQTDAMDVDSQNSMAPSLEQMQPDSTMSIDQSVSSHNMQVDQCDAHLGQVKADAHEAIANSTVHVVPCPRVDQVLARRFSGHSKCNTPFEFIVPQDIHDGISRWKDCMNPSIDLETTACITLECFPSDDIDGNLSDNELSAKLDARSSSWPDSGSLYLLLGSNDTTETIPLAPPLEVTPDNSVDLSEFVLSGINKAQLLSTRKLPGVLFVVHAHSPTAKQQERVTEMRKQERDWQNFLTDLTRPFIHPSI